MWTQGGDLEGHREAGSRFLPTRWTVVVAAADPSASESAAALETLCRAYWYPLYAYVRRLGHSPADAQDLTQAFFARLLEKRWLAGIDREKGRFRTFLLVALKRFVANEWDRENRQKRGGHAVHLPLDTELAEEQYRTESVESFPADRIFERRWALTLIERTMARLRREAAEAGRAGEFDRLKGVLTVERANIAYADLARDLAMSEGAVRVAAHRLRRRFREMFREEVADTVAVAEDVEEELRYLLEALAE